MVGYGYFSGVYRRTEALASILPFCKKSVL